MKVIFLDIDGVLQPYNSGERFKNDAKKLMEKLSKELNIDFNELCHEMDVAAVYYDWDKDAIRRIKTILDTTNSKIVISSDWRSKEKPMKMPALLKIQNLDKYYVGQTDDYGCFEVPEEREKLPYRTIEILNYLDNHKEIINYVVIDDQLREEGIEGHFVETYKLINDEQMNKCIEILGKDNKENA